MMAGLSAYTRIKLARALTRLGDIDPTARDEAGRAAHAIVTGSRLTWHQVLRPPAIEKKLPELGAWRGTVARCLDEHPDKLRVWEATFLRELRAFRRLSVKQRYVLKSIADRLLSC